MAKARDPPAVSPVESEEDSGEEEESLSGEENEGSESEPEPEQPRTQVSKTPKKATSQPVDSSSDDEEESESETDSDSPVKNPDPNIKPIASKPMDVERAPTLKNRSKSNTAGQAKTTLAAGAKRPTSAAHGEEKEAKKAKKKSETGVEASEKKGNTSADPRKLFQRLWSEDDEIALLNGFLEYQAKKKADPLNDMDDFHEFIKKSIHIDVSNQQIQDKIRRLKKKYENNAEKEKKGKEKVSSKTHEQIGYELSKRIWGKERNGGNPAVETPKVNGTVALRNRSKTTVAATPMVVEQEETLKEEKNKNLDGEESLEGLKGMSFCQGNSGMDDWIVNQGKDFIQKEKKVELDAKWNKLKAEELELHLRKLEVMHDQTVCVLESVKRLLN